MNEALFAELSAWLTEAGLAGTPETAIVSGFCDRCVAAIANRGREDHFFFADPPRVMSACARKASLDIRHLHLGFNRVGNETIFMGGMMHSIELFRTGL